MIVKILIVAGVISIVLLIREIRKEKKKHTCPECGKFVTDIMFTSGTYLCECGYKFLGEENER